MAILFLPYTPVQHTSCIWLINMLASSKCFVFKAFPVPSMSSCAFRFFSVHRLPFPWLLYSLINDFKSVSVSSAGLFCAIVLLFLMLLFVIISIAACKWRMSKLLGFLMFLLYFVFLVVSVMLEDKVISCPVSIWAWPPSTFPDQPTMRLGMGMPMPRSGIHKSLEQTFSIVVETTLLPLFLWGQSLRKSRAYNKPRGNIRVDMIHLWVM